MTKQQAIEEAVKAMNSLKPLSSHAPNTISHATFTIGMLVAYVQQSIEAEKNK